MRKIVREVKFVTIPVLKYEGGKVVEVGELNFIGDPTENQINRELKKEFDLYCFIGDREEKTKTYAMSIEQFIASAESLESEAEGEESESEEE